MNAMVIGATSFVGARIAIAFAPGNNVYLIGRDPYKLASIADRCSAAGAIQAVQLVQDLSAGPGRVTSAIDSLAFDLVINVASATSRLRDDEIASGNLQGDVMADLLAPVQIIQRILNNRPANPLQVIFVSTVLTQVKSPNRSIYSSLKILQEAYLHRIKAEHAGVELLVVRISKVIPTNHDSPDTAKLAAAVLSAYREKKREMYFGLTGRALTALFYTQPIIFRGAMALQRALRGGR